MELQIQKHRTDIFKVVNDIESSEKKNYGKIKAVCLSCHWTYGCQIAMV